MQIFIMKKILLLLVLGAIAPFSKMYSMTLQSNNTNKIPELTQTAATGSVSVVDNGTTVVLKNQFLSVTINKSSATITSFVYDGENILSGGYSGGKLYWSWNMPNYQNPSGCTYTLAVDPKDNNYNCAEIKLHMTYNSSNADDAAQDVDIYYAVTDSVSGLYAAGKLSHPASYPENPGGEWRMAGYVGTQFDWMVVDSARNQVIPNYTASTEAVSGAPKEVMRITSSGSFYNHYECKYDYSADFGETRTWGWVSTTKNRGIWMTIPSLEYYPGGPMKRELMCHSAPVILNMFGGTHYGMGGDGVVASGEKWEKIYGPFLIYCNKTASGSTDVPNTLWEDAKKQTKLEEGKWPYSWFSDTAYIQAGQRGTIKGKLYINDPTASSTSAAGMWIGVAIPPSSTTGVTDFQMWSKNYQFWVKTDSTGNFVIPNVIPGVYNMYAFGPGAAGQMTKESYVTVAADSVSDLDTVKWTPDRIAPTVWEIGIPDRTAKEFKHGDDYWAGGTYPDPNWAKFMNYTTEFPDGVNYTIGQSDWATDWNYAQPYNVVGSDQTSAPVWTVNFSLASDPTANSQSSVYVAAASNWYAPLIVKVNETIVSTLSTGDFFSNKSNALIRMGIHGAFADLRFTFSSSLLHEGSNAISFTERKSGGDIQYDYLRLESPGTSLTSSISTPQSFSDVRIYPNPFTDYINIKTNSDISATADIEIKSIDGKTIYRKQLTDNGDDIININLPRLNTGIYLLEITDGTRKGVYKILKK